MEKLITPQKIGLDASDIHHILKTPAIAALDAFDYIGDAMLILDHNYRFYYINKAMADNDRITALFKVTVDDQVAFKDAHQQTLLEQKIKGMQDFLKDRALRVSSNYLMCYEQMFYQIKIKPWFHVTLFDVVEDASPLIMLVIKDLNKDRLLSSREISQTFGLSITEAIICRYMCKGYSLDYIASIRNVSKHTVRHQVKSIYQKTKTSSQSQLVAFVLSIGID